MRTTIAAIITLLTTVPATGQTINLLTETPAHVASQILEWSWFEDFSFRPGSRWATPSTSWHGKRFVGAFGLVPQFEPAAGGVWESRYDGSWAQWPIPQNAVLGIVAATIHSQGDTSGNSAKATLTSFGAGEGSLWQNDSVGILYATTNPTP